LKQANSDAWDDVASAGGKFGIEQIALPDEEAETLIVAETEDEGR
jgi:hypothetical protein